MKTPTLEEMLEQMGCDVSYEMKRNKTHKSLLLPSPIISTYLNEHTESVPFPHKTLLMADRLYTTAIILKYYLTQQCGATCCNIAVSLDEAIDFASMDLPEYLIYVGYQIKHFNYIAIEELRHTTSPPFVAIWGNRDRLIEDTCWEYDIGCLIDRRDNDISKVPIMLLQSGV